ncbi:LytR/AlgR family response regulator transcription factor [Chitinophaga japonensis]|uniref:LytTR family two component transcriptional regulator n=1 Tax=Chitinophaga japonensis TaxID=104662 RepID=A0A562SKZ8_CHIJA|nr:LytTR family DNA-binding domain-containing protein [Chitinophaga japonensis]TWI81991.1 LytTR family two component transcriptional regulator [Chitinophaga japonensis]
MIRAVIIDDEIHAAERLADLLAHYCAAGVTLAGHALDAAAGLALIRDTKPDLVLLDIHLGAATGFELLEQFPDPDFSVIFTTAYEQHALQAIRFSALDYLLKPVDPDELVAAIQKKTNLAARAPQKASLELLFSNMRFHNQGLAKIMIPTMHGFELVNIPDILRCHSDVNYTTIHLVNGDSFLVAKTIGEFEHLLASHHFYRIHQSHLVNLNFIRRYHKGKGGIVVLQNGLELPVAARRKEGFLQKVQSLL